MRKAGILILLLALSSGAHAWMDSYAPKLKSAPAKLSVLSQKNIKWFVENVKSDSAFVSEYSKGVGVDLNNDGYKDFVFIIPWMGNGLSASGYNAHFIVSNGKGGRVENIIEGYEIETSDIVNIKGKIYFRHSAFFESFEKSQHNHWVFQIYSFDTNGIMRCANADIGKSFPAATIFYSNPKFKAIELTDADRRKIAQETKPKSQVFNL
jgi:hypothetical protein